MSADFPSSNPFRKRGPAEAHAQAPAPAPPNTNSSSSHPPPPAPSRLDTQSLEPPKKITKRVRVQSPPPLSPDIDSASTIEEGTYNIPTRLTAGGLQDDDPFDGSTSHPIAEESDERHRGAPANPFSKTLETMERPESNMSVAATTNTGGYGKPSLDVDAFQRLLMTGDSGLGQSTSPSNVQMPVAQHTLVPGDSSTDTSSLSRHSIFEAVQEPHPESPRTSHEIEDPDEYRRGLLPGSGNSSNRQKPPPPSSRHGKLIRLELRDSPPTTSTQRSSLRPSPSLTDLNKPLPPSPRRESHESDAESIFDKEAAGKTPEPPSPSISIFRKQLPPAPPLARRHSQMVADSKLTRSNSNRLSSKAEEDETGSGAVRIGSISARSRSDSVKAPPPPPSRRMGSLRANSASQGVSTQSSISSDPLTSPSTISLPPPPPAARGASRSVSADRPPSVRSLDLSSPSPLVVGKRISMLAPPPPPPPRHGRKNSAETTSQNTIPSRRPSAEEYLRKSMDSSIRRGSIDIPEESETTQDENKPDILAEMSRLQREIDDMRIQGERRVT